MRMLTLLGILGHLSLTVGCADAPGRPVSETGEVATVTQASQLELQSLFPVVGSNGAHVVLTAGFDPSDIEILYFGDKTTLTGHQPMQPVVAERITIPPFATRTHRIDFLDPSFAGGYGSVFVRADPVGTSISPFQTFLATEGSLFSVGGTVFRAISYRVPYVTGTSNLVMALTNLEASPITIQFLNLKPSSESRSVTIQGLSTFRFDAAQLGWDISGSASINVMSTGGFFTLMGYADRKGGRVRAVPVRSGPDL